MRADLFLTVNGYVRSRQRAKQLIDEGSVRIDGKTVSKAAFEVSDGEHNVEVLDTQKYVGRGGLKLEGALDAFGISVKDLRALDVGASTGGFTDCLLQRGAGHVVAIDAGKGQLAPELAKDTRVTSIEHLNARDAILSDVGGIAFDLIVMDVSFISATYVIPQFPSLLTESGEAIVLVKPQFEVGKAYLGKGGIVKDPAAHRMAVERVLESARSVGLTPVGLISSPIEGGDGNREFLVRLSKRENREEISKDTISRVTQSGARKK